MGLPGSQRTVQRLVDAHYAPLYRYAYRLSGSAAARHRDPDFRAEARNAAGRLRHGAISLIRIVAFHSFLRSEHGCPPARRLRTPL